MPSAPSSLISIRPLSLGVIGGASSFDMVNLGGDMTGCESIPEERQHPGATFPGIRFTLEVFVQSAE